MVQVYTNKTQEYGTSIPNELLKLQTDNWGTSSADFFTLILMSGFD